MVSLLRLAARCPTCGAAPPWRVEPDEPARYTSDPPDKRVATVRCQRKLKGGRKCGTLYAVHARDYQNAG